MSVAEFAIRPARPGEAEVLTEVCVRSKAHWGYDAAFMSAASRLLRIRERDIAAGGILVAVVGGVPCGVAALVPLRRPQCCELSHLFVTPECLGRGIGRALFAAAIDQAVKHGASRVSILSDPNAAAFYAKLGARRCGEAPSGVAKGRMLPLFEFTIARCSAAG